MHRNSVNVIFLIPEQIRGEASNEARKRDAHGKRAFRV